MDDIQEYGVLTGTDFLDADASTAPFSWPAFRRDHDYADLLSELPEESDVLKETVVPSPLLVVFLPVPAPPAPAPIKPRGSVSNAAIPMYDLWVTVLRDQPRPKRADEFLPKLKRIFVEEGVPAELAWIPEIESMFNPRARHPGGACGLFQLMPITARAQGLRLRPYDERTNPEKSARAAATLLRELHEMFDSWPLAIAAYNAGEGCVRRTLRARDATTFAEIADRLPVETRLYVPRVFATLAIREGVSPASLPAPRYIAQTGF
jgi:membrane-bound lytic murein transglycosylase D